MDRNNTAGALVVNTTNIKNLNHHKSELNL